MRFLLRFVRDEDGQDLVEYTLLVAFTALAAGAVFASAGSGTSGIWGQANNTLAGADTSVAGAPSASPPADTGGDGGDGGDNGHHGHGGS
jgi:Flp pilus assembly pilin Flp